MSPRTLALFLSALLLPAPSLALSCAPLRVLFVVRVSGGKVGDGFRVAERMSGLECDRYPALEPVPPEAAPFLADVLQGAADGLVEVRTDSGCLSRWTTSPAEWQWASGQSASPEAVRRWQERKALCRDTVQVSAAPEPSGGLEAARRDWTRRVRGELASYWAWKLGFLVPVLAAGLLPFFAFRRRSRTGRRLALLGLLLGQGLLAFFTLVVCFGTWVRGPWPLAGLAICSWLGGAFVVTCRGLARDRAR